jgi:Serpin (serine protease inhibitor)
MMTSMTPEGVRSTSSVGRLAPLVDGYARRVYPSVLDQHGGAGVASPLGVWLLLAACVSGARGSQLAALEQALGCSPSEAGALLAQFLHAPPPALRVAIALWVAAGDATSAVSEWSRGLPDGVQSGSMPSQEEADAWARHETLGLIRAFPLDIDETTRIVLASALATKVSWEKPFDVAPAAEGLGGASPWRGAVGRLLWDAEPSGHALIASTRSAGLVAVHCAVAREGLTVISVSGDPGVERSALLEAAHEVGDALSRGGGDVACSLWDLPLGPGHSWEITEREVDVYVPEPQPERIAGVALPAWSVRTELDLTRSPAFAADAALETLREMVGPRPDDRCDAVQTAVASFTRYGFEAAAVTALGVRTAALRRPSGRVTERSAVLRFDHPYAALAVAGRVGAADAGFTVASEDPTLTGVPLFSAWVAAPVEPEDRPPAPTPTADAP